LGKLTVYHGTNVEIKEPRIIVGKYTKDFGPGFYCTIIKEQARRWAKKLKPAIINIYEVRLSENLKIKTFEEMDEEWLDFIVDCRYGRSHDYDIVIGAMADDQIYNFIEDFVDGALTREQFWIMAKFKYPTHQICFCTPLALEQLTYRKMEEIADDRTNEQRGQ